MQVGWSYDKGCDRFYLLAENDGEQWYYTFSRDQFMAFIEITLEALLEAKVIPERQEEIDAIGQAKIIWQGRQN